MTRKELIKFIFFLIICWIPAFIGSDSILNVSDLYPLENGSYYFDYLHFFRLYLWTPIVVISACLLFISPGLLLTMGTNTVKNAGHWFLLAICVSILFNSITISIVELFLEIHLIGTTFAIFIGLITFICFVFILIRIYQGQNIYHPLKNDGSKATLLSSLVFTYILLIFLCPKLYWENFNGDGAHAFESSRLLLQQIVPFWEKSAGVVSNFPGINSLLFTFPNSWFMRFFGETEASIRLPYIIYIIALHCGLIAIINQERRKPLCLIDIWMIWLGLSIYTVIMAYSATYNPYNADIALPGTQDTLLMVCFVGFILSFFKRQKFWLFYFQLLTLISAPAGLMLIGLWIICVILIWRPIPKQILFLTIGYFILCKILMIMFPILLNVFNLPTPGEEHGLIGMLKKYHFIQFGDYKRVAYLLFPSGIIPAIYLFYWKKHDNLSKTLTALIFIYFLSFYLMRYYSHHYFVPVMILPLIVFWRSVNIKNQKFNRYRYIAVGLAGITALLISIPENLTIHTTARLIGESIDDRIGGYDKMNPASFRRSHKILEKLFPLSIDPRVPEESYGGSPLQWYYYANRKKGNKFTVNYIMKLTDQVSPTNGEIIACEDGVEILCLNEEVWKKHQSLKPPSPADSPIYRIDRNTLFPGRDKVRKSDSIDFLNILNRLGFKFLTDKLIELDDQQSELLE